MDRRTHGSMRLYRKSPLNITNFFYLVEYFSEEVMAIAPPFKTVWRIAPSVILFEMVPGGCAPRLRRQGAVPGGEAEPWAASIVTDRSELGP